jgi:hypothetical protein
MNAKMRYSTLDPEPLGRWSMAKRAQAVVFLHGLPVEQHGKYLAKLIDGLRQYAAHRNLDLTAADSAAPRNAKRKRFLFSGMAEYPGIDLEEAYWADLQPTLSTRAVLEKVVQGFGMLYFWAGSRRVYSAALSSKPLAIGSIGGSFCLLAWYIVAVGAVLTALSTDPKGFMIPDWIVRSLQAMSGTGLDQLLAYWKKVGNFWVLAVLAIVTSLKVFTTTVDVSFAVTSYLRDDDLAERVQNRLLAILHDVQAEQRYAGIVVVAHSFGTVSAVQALATYQSAIPIRLITLGSPMRFVAARRQTLQMQSRPSHAIPVWRAGMISILIRIGSAPESRCRMGRRVSKGTS